MLVSDRVIKGDCLLVFVLWRDKPRVVMHMRGTSYHFSEKPTKQGLLVIALYTVDV